VQEKSFPAEGIVLLKLKSDVYGGQYDLEDLVQQRGTSSTTSLSSAQLSSHRCFLLVN
jgi:hypothetical protein